ncbi:MAG: glycoside hydrolase family 15 protein [Flavobacteriaceae bacterium]|nr:glycoside hydrolase family 15 protein [Flavobacteriaceae bacterium]
MDNLDFGIVGNCRSAALISKEGSVDWCCLPEFDSPSVFGKLLDAQIGGSFSIHSYGNPKITQKYLESTNILVTRFEQEDGVFELLDFMPRYKKENGDYHAPPEFMRYVKHVSGAPKVVFDYDPKLEYAAGNTQTYAKNDFVVSLTESSKYDTLYLYTNISHQDLLDKKQLVLEDDVYFVVSYHEKIEVPNLYTVSLELNRTKVYWLNWSAKTPTFPIYNDEILRSALTLKLLSYDKSGAVLAAATTSLPETIGEVRNWDYRFCWIRDASMVISIVSRLGHRKMVQRYLQFVIDLIPDKDEKLQIMYGINKEKKLTEATLDHLSGYENSKPVRIGNAAYKQRQNDIYGILMDVIHTQIEGFQNEVENLEELWSITKGIVWVVAAHWQEPDKGIWEFRSEDRHFTFSKMLCWVAIDRAIKIAKKLNKPHNVTKWTPLAKAIEEDILNNAWNDEVQAFTQSYGSKDLDASVLLMENYGFVDAKDPRFVKTVHAIERELCHEGLMYRYKNEDDFGLPSSSFTICTFWFINSLNKIGERDKAMAMFDTLLSYSNHLGLFSEDIDFSSKRLLGNFPQAYSHLALIETALNFSDTAPD